MWCVRPRPAAVGCRPSLERLEDRWTPSADAVPTTMHWESMPAPVLFVVQPPVFPPPNPLAALNGPIPTGGSSPDLRDEAWQEMGDVRLHTARWQGVGEVESAANETPTAPVMDASSDEAPASGEGTTPEAPPMAENLPMDEGE